VDRHMGRSCSMCWWNQLGKDWKPAGSRRYGGLQFWIKEFFQPPVRFSLPWWFVELSEQVQLCVVLDEYNGCWKHSSPTAHALIIQGVCSIKSSRKENKLNFFMHGKAIYSRIECFSPTSMILAFLCPCIYIQNTLVYRSHWATSRKGESPNRTGKGARWPISCTPFQQKDLTQGFRVKCTSQNLGVRLVGEHATSGVSAELSLPTEM
jgi:hypothetical protein